MKKYAYSLLFCFLFLNASQAQTTKNDRMKQPQPFRIHVDQRVLDDLHDRLAHTRWPDEPKDAGWGYGTNPEFLRSLVQYWKNGYDWRKQEAMLNQFPQYTAEIDGVTIHFIHVRGKGKNPRPVLLTHGWPDCFYRFYKVIPMLSDPARFGGDPDQSFDVIVPSMPGYGFSERVAMNVQQIAGLWSKLMTEVLGYKAYYAAGGDVGTHVTKSLALKYPEQVKAIHLTDVGYPTGMEDPSTLSQPEKDFVQVIQQWVYAEGAYFMLHATKPQTLGYGLNDSPVGLASWITEKFNGWSDTKGNIENSFTKDELLTNIMIYWVTQTINTSVRSYLEDARAVYAQPGGPQPEKRSTPPAAVAVFPAEAQVPREWAERTVNVQRYNKMPKGGHFAALEVPDLWVNDLRTFFIAH